MFEFTRPRIELQGSKPTMIPIHKVDTSKAERVPAFRAPTDVREGLNKTIQWYKQSFCSPGVR